MNKNAVQFRNGLMEIEKRKEEFIKGYGELVKKYELDFASYPVMQPSQTGVWNMIIQTTLIEKKPEPVKSNLMEDV